MYTVEACSIDVGLSYGIHIVALVCNNYYLVIPG